MNPQRETYESNKLQKRLRRMVGQAIADYDMIRAGDRVMVACPAARTAMPCWTSCSA